MIKKLIVAATVTDATKIPFRLTNDDFSGDPAVRASGLLVNDVVTVWVDVAGVWVDTGLVLNSTTPFVELKSLGLYAVTLVIALVSTVTVEVETSGRL